MKVTSECLPVGGVPAVYAFFRAHPLTPHVGARKWLIGMTLCKTREMGRETTRADSICRIPPALGCTSHYTHVMMQRRHSRGRWGSPWFRDITNLCETALYCPRLPQQLSPVPRLLPWSLVASVCAAQTKRGKQDTEAGKLLLGSSVYVFVRVRSHTWSGSRGLTFPACACVMMASRDDG